MTKLYAQEKRVFDINKVTVVGSPIITSDGVASGFDRENYIHVIKDWQKSLTNFSIEFKFTPKASDATLQSLGFMHGTPYSVGFFVLKTGENWLFTVRISGGDRVSVPLNLEEDVAILVKYNSGVWSIYKNNIFIQNFTFNISSSVFSNVYLGNTPTNNLLIYAGSIDLSQFKIYVDGELVYSPTKPVYSLERRKEGFDLSKFTVVGSPTITEYGVASGFSAGNYVKTSSVINYGNSFEILLKFTYRSSTSHQYLFSTTTDLSIICGIYTSGRLYLALGANGSVVIPESGGKTYLIDGDDYYLSLSYKNGAYILKTSIDGLNWVEEINKPSTSQILTDINTLNLGMSRQGTGVCSCSINLPSLSITVDGKEVFTGAKEKFYAMRGR